MLKNTSLWKRGAALVLSVAVVLAFAACGTTAPQNGSADSQDTSSVTQSDGAAGLSADAQDNSVNEEKNADGTEADNAGEEVSGNTDGADDAAYTHKIMLSFANKDYIENGDESVPKLVRNVETNIEVEDDSLETLMKDIIEALRTVPNGIENADTLVTDRYKIRGVSVESATAIVDVSGEGIEDASMYEEEFFVYQIADSILHSVNGIDSVQFLIDGSQSAEFVYMDIYESYTKESCDAFAGE